MGNELTPSANRGNRLLPLFCGAIGNAIVGFLLFGYAFFHDAGSTARLAFVVLFFTGVGIGGCLGFVLKDCRIFDVLCCMSVLLFFLSLFIAGSLQKASGPDVLHVMALVPWALAVQGCSWGLTARSKKRNPSG